MWFLCSLATAGESLRPTRTTGPITLDGRLEEESWASAPPISGFTTSLPSENQPDPGVEARLLYDEEALYVGFVVQNHRPIEAPISRRDQTLLHEWVGVVLDSYRDGRRAFTFRVTPSGIQADGIYLESDGDLWNPDLSWDGIWRAESSRTADGYSVEIAIDWKTLRYPRNSPQDWGVILLHNVPTPWAFSTWPPVGRATESRLAQAAVLGPLSPPPSTLRPELLGTLLASFGQAPLRPGLRFLNPETNPAVDAGVGLRLGIGSSLTADITLNPDFSQIEADPDQVTANVKYPLYYSEKRPFFLEGADVFVTPLEAVYSRSIADPIGAAKLTGRAGPVAVGVLSAWDQAPQASTIYLDYATGKLLPAWDEPDALGAQVDLLRGQVDLGNGAAAGLLFSDKELFRKEGGLLANRVGGLDGSLPIGSHSNLGGQLLGSYTDFSDGSSSPGLAWRLQGRYSAKHATLKLEQTHISSGFRAENGFLEEVGRTGGSLSAGLRWDDLGPLVSLQPKLKASGNVDSEGKVSSASAGPALRLLGDSAYGEAGFIAWKERYLGVGLNGWTTNGFVDFTPAPGRELYLTWNLGPEPAYDAATPEEVYNGFAYGLSVEGLLTVGGRLEFLYDGTVQTFGRQFNEAPLQTTILQRLRISYGFSREFSSRLIGEWNTEEQTVDSSALLVWERTTGTAFYLGYGQKYGIDGLEDQSVFAKVSLLWRP